MRLIIAMMQHETNTFPPVPATLARFARGAEPTVPLEGKAAEAAYANTGLAALGAYLELAAGAEVVLPVGCQGGPQWASR